MTGQSDQQLALDLAIPPLAYQLRLPLYGRSQPVSKQTREPTHIEGIQIPLLPEDRTNIVMRVLYRFSTR